jgi:hypothetical protein
MASLSFARKIWPTVRPGAAGDVFTCPASARCYTSARLSPRVRPLLTAV